MLEVGTIDKALGLKGEVVVTLTTDRTERLDPGSELHTDRGVLVVESAAPHQHRWRVQFQGYATREEAESLHGLTLRAEPIDDPDTWFVHQLIGAEVVTVDGATAGTCTSVVPNPAYDMLELDGEVLVPLPFVIDVDTAVDPARVVIDPPEGLFDLSES